MKGIGNVMVKNITEEECRQIGGKYEDGICYVPKRQLRMSEKILFGIKKFVGGIRKSHPLTTGTVGVAFGWEKLAPILATSIANGFQNILLCGEYVERGKEIIKNGADFEELERIAKEYEYNNCGSKNDFYRQVFSK